MRQHNPAEGWTFLIKPDMWEKAGGVDPGQLYQDWMLLEAARKAGATACRTSVPLWGARVHADSTPHDSPLHPEAWNRMRAKCPYLWA
jgi:hypothetical protein